ncbi:hypothetical protein ACIGXM_35550, partial [Kitasatospora sp. NPDC052896]|uniref:hypothetical protein n=1 Tax=Kitasatospora sp. NPDC052896 TaxID=3364061 RepID=UPI0037C9E7C8
YRIAGRSRATSRPTDETSITQTGPSTHIDNYSRDDGTDQTMHDLLRWQAREKRGRDAGPPAQLSE